MKEGILFVKERINLNLPSTGKKVLLGNSKLSFLVQTGEAKYCNQFI